MYKFICANLSKSRNFTSSYKKLAQNKKYHLDGSSGKTALNHECVEEKYEENQEQADEENGVTTDTVRPTTSPSPAGRFQLRPKISRLKYATSSPTLKLKDPPKFYTGNFLTVEPPTPSISKKYFHVYSITPAPSTPNRYSSSTNIQKFPFSDKTNENYKKAMQDVYNIKKQKASSQCRPVSGNKPAFIPSEIWTRRHKKSSKTEITYPTHTIKHKLSFSQRFKIREGPANHEANELAEELQERKKTQQKFFKSYKANKITYPTLVENQKKKGKISAALARHEKAQKVQNDTSDVPLIQIVKAISENVAKSKDKPAERQIQSKPPLSMRMQAIEDDFESLIKSHPTLENASGEIKMKLKNKFIQLLLKSKQEACRPKVEKKVVKEAIQVDENQQKVEEELADISENLKDNEDGTTEKITEQARNDTAQITSHPYMTNQQVQQNEYLMRYPKRVWLDTSKNFDIDKVCIKDTATKTGSGFVSRDIVTEQPKLNYKNLEKEAAALSSCVQRQDQKIETENAAQKLKIIMASSRSTEAKLELLKSERIKLLQELENVSKLRAEEEAKLKCTKMVQECTLDPPDQIETINAEALKKKNQAERLKTIMSNQICNQQDLLFREKTLELKQKNRAIVESKFRKEREALQNGLVQKTKQIEEAKSKVHELNKAAQKAELLLKSRKNKPFPLVSAPFEDAIRKEEVGETSEGISLDSPQKLNDLSLDPAADTASKYLESHKADKVSTAKGKNAPVMKIKQEGKLQEKLNTVTSTWLKYSTEKASKVDKGVDILNKNNKIADNISPKKMSTERKLQSVRIALNNTTGREVADPNEIEGREKTIEIREEVAEINKNTPKTTLEEKDKVSCSPSLKAGKTSTGGELADALEKNSEKGEGTRIKQQFVGTALDKLAYKESLDQYRDKPSEERAKIKEEPLKKEGKKLETILKEKNELLAKAKLIKGSNIEELFGDTNEIFKQETTTSQKEDNSIITDDVAINQVALANPALKETCEKNMETALGSALDQETNVQNKEMGQNSTLLSPLKVAIETVTKADEDKLVNLAEPDDTPISKTDPELNIQKESDQKDVKIAPVLNAASEAEVKSEQGEKTTEKKTTQKEEVKREEIPKSPTILTPRRLIPLKKLAKIASQVESTLENSLDELGETERLNKIAQISEEMAIKKKQKRKERRLREMAKQRQNSLSSLRGATSKPKLDKVVDLLEEKAKIGEKVKEKIQQISPEKKSRAHVSKHKIRPKVLPLKKAGTNQDSYTTLDEITKYDELNKMAQTLSLTRKRKPIKKEKRIVVKKSPPTNKPPVVLKPALTKKQSKAKETEVKTMEQPRSEEKPNDNKEDDIHSKIKDPNKLPEQKFSARDGQHGRKLTRPETPKPQVIKENIQKNDGKKVNTEKTEKKDQVKEENTAFALYPDSPKVGRQKGCGSGNDQRPLIIRTSEVRTIKPDSDQKNNIEFFSKDKEEGAGSSNNSNKGKPATTELTKKGKSESAEVAKREKPVGAEIVKQAQNLKHAVDTVQSLKIDFPSMQRPVPESSAVEEIFKDQNELNSFKSRILRKFFDEKKLPGSTEAIYMPKQRLIVSNITEVEENENHLTNLNKILKLEDGAVLRTGDEILILEEIPKTPNVTNKKIEEEAEQFAFVPDNDALLEPKVNKYKTSATDNKDTDLEIKLRDRKLEFGEDLFQYNHRAFEDVQRIDEMISKIRDLEGILLKQREVKISETRLENKPRVPPFPKQPPAKDIKGGKKEKPKGPKDMVLPPKIRGSDPSPKNVPKTIPKEEYTIPSKKANSTEDLDLVKDIYFSKRLKFDENLQAAAKEISKVLLRPNSPSKNPKDDTKDLEKAIGDFIKEEQLDEIPAKNDVSKNVSKDNVIGDRKRQNHEKTLKKEIESRSAQMTVTNFRDDAARKRLSNESQIPKESTRTEVMSLRKQKTESPVKYHASKELISLKNQKTESPLKYAPSREVTSLKNQKTESPVKHAVTQDTTSLNNQKSESPIKYAASQEGMSLNHQTVNLPVKNSALKSVPKEKVSVRQELSDGELHKTLRRLSESKSLNEKSFSEKTYVTNKVVLKAPTVKSLTITRASYEKIAKNALQNIKIINKGMVSKTSENAIKAGGNNDVNATPSRPMSCPPLPTQTRKLRKIDETGKSADDKAVLRATSCPPKQFKESMLQAPKIKDSSRFLPIISQEISKLPVKTEPTKKLLIKINTNKPKTFTKRTPKEGNIIVKAVPQRPASSPPGTAQPQRLRTVIENSNLSEDLRAASCPPKSSKAVPAPSSQQITALSPPHAESAQKPQEIKTNYSSWSSQAKRSPSADVKKTAKTSMNKSSTSVKRASSARMTTRTPSLSFPGRRCSFDAPGGSRGGGGPKKNKSVTISVFKQYTSDSKGEKKHPQKMKLTGYSSETQLVCGTHSRTFGINTDHDRKSISRAGISTSPSLQKIEDKHHTTKSGSVDRIAKQTPETTTNEEDKNKKAIFRIGSDGDVFVIKRAGEDFAKSSHGKGKKPDNVSATKTKKQHLDNLDLNRKRIEGRNRSIETVKASSKRTIKEESIENSHEKRDIEKKLIAKIEQIILKPSDKNQGTTKLTNSEIKLNNYDSTEEQNLSFVFNENRNYPRGCVAKIVTVYDNKASAKLRENRELKLAKFNRVLANDVTNGVKDKSWDFLFAGVGTDRFQAAKDNFFRNGPKKEDHKQFKSNLRPDTEKKHILKKNQSETKLNGPKAKIYDNKLFKKLIGSSKIIDEAQQSKSKQVRKISEPDHKNLIKRAYKETILKLNLPGLKKVDSEIKKKSDALERKRGNMSKPDTQLINPQISRDNIVNKNTSESEGIVNMFRKKTSKTSLEIRPSGSPIKPPNTFNRTSVINILKRNTLNYNEIEKEIIEQSNDFGKRNDSFSTINIQPKSSRIEAANAFIKVCGKNIFKLDNPLFRNNNSKITEKLKEFAKRNESKNNLKVSQIEATKVFKKSSRETISKLDVPDLKNDAKEIKTNSNVNTKIDKSTNISNFQKEADKSH